MYCDVFDTISGAWLGKQAAQKACNLKQLAQLPQARNAVVARHEDGSLAMLGGGSVVFHKSWLRLGR